MKLKYTGPKEIISPHGIDFKNGKDDKYVYIYPTLQIYNAIHHEYKRGVVYTHNIEGKRANDEELLNEILALKPTMKEELEEKIESLENFLDEEVNAVDEHKELNEEEKKVYKNNLLIMRSYKLQRGINKIVYNQLIETIVDEIFENRLKEINSPFNERFWHILQTIQGELSNHDHRSIGSIIDINHAEEKIRIKLKINSIGK